MPIQFSVRTLYKVLGVIGVLGGTASCVITIVFSLQNSEYLLNHITSFISSLITLFIGLYLIRRSYHMEDRQIALCVPLQPRATILP